MAWHSKANPNRLDITEQNALAVLLQRNTIEIPQRYGRYRSALLKLESAKLVGKTGNLPLGYDTWFLTAAGKKLITKLNGELHPKSKCKLIA